MTIPPLSAVIAIAVVFFLGTFAGRFSAREEAQRCVESNERYFKELDGVRVSQAEINARLFTGRDKQRQLETKLEAMLKQCGLHGGSR